MAHTNPEILWTVAGIFGLLAVAEVLTAILGRLRPALPLTEVKGRIRAWWWMVGVFSLALLLGSTLSILLFLGLSALAFREFLQVSGLKPGRQIWLLVIPILLLQYLAVYLQWYGAFIIVVPVFAFLMLPLRSLLADDPRDFLRHTGSIHWGLMATVFCLSHAAFLLILRDPTAPAIRQGPGLMLFLVALTELNDVSQFLAGRAFGRRKILPGISPGKTWAGLAGGVLATSLLAQGLGPLLTPLSRTSLLVAGLLISLGGFLGDIFFSMLKRDAGVKNAGTLLPGHGGLLDRVDSLVVTAPLFFHFVYYLVDWQTFGRGVCAPFAQLP
ncbi:MAG: phosphatidate cytidylyltransferase [Candidatus Cloacimonetes bacterium]|nr:phosphatidate cytidylyltransferase [Candidatus Cloacimonadota bacterium]